MDLKSEIFDEIRNFRRRRTINDAPTLIDRIQSLPLEIIDMIEDWTFEIDLPANGILDREVRYVQPGYKPPSILQVCRYYRKYLIKTYYHREAIWEVSLDDLKFWEYSLRKRDFQRLKYICVKLDHPVQYNPSWYKRYELRGLDEPICARVEMTKKQVPRVKGTQVLFEVKWPDHGKMWNHYLPVNYSWIRPINVEGPEQREDTEFIEWDDYMMGDAAADHFEGCELVDGVCKTHTIIIPPREEEDAPLLPPKPSHIAPS